jgi:predicted DNA-binding transcriptional regulator YafY
VPTSTSTSRLLLVLSLLQTRRDWPGQVLADRLDVTPRTVRRDVDRLRELGYRIHAVKGPDGGYRLEAGSELPPLLFDDDQVVALAVALKLAAMAGAGVEEAAVRALTTVRQVMPSRLRHRLDALEFTAMSPGAGAGAGAGSGAGSSDASTVTPEALVALSTAVRAREVVRFDYAGQALPGGGGAPPAFGPLDPLGPLDPSNSSEPPPALVPPRRAEPHHLVSRGGRWYLVAWDLDRDDWRTFRVDRMTLRTPGGPRFALRSLPGGASVTDFVAARFKGSADVDRWPCRGSVVLAAPAGDVLPYVGDGTVEPLDDDRCRVTLGSWSWVALAAAFARFDVDVSKAEPAELAAAFDLLGARLRRASTS